jgi:hypothetical protein
MNRDGIAACQTHAKPKRIRKGEKRQQNTLKVTIASERAKPKQSLQD